MLHPGCWAQRCLYGWTRHLRLVAPHLCVPCSPKQEQLNRESERARRAAAECDEARQRAEELSQRVHQAQQDAAARDGVVASLVRGVEGLQRDLARLQW